jgi:hypothetical protein
MVQIVGLLKGAFQVKCCRNAQVAMEKETCQTPLRWFGHNPTKTSRGPGRSEVYAQTKED